MDILRDRRGQIGIVLVGMILLMVVFAPLLAPSSPYETDPANRLQGPSHSHWLGTDNLGRDTLSRAIYGARTAMFIGITSLAAAFGVGLLLGIIAAYFGKAVDNIILLVFDALRSFPPVILAIVIISVMGPSVSNIVLALAVAYMPMIGRTARARTLSVMQEDYVEAARVMGASTPGILFRYVLPNIFGPLVIMAGMDISFMIIIESGLAFIGLGVAPPTASWGEMIRLGFRFMIVQPWLLFVPSMFLGISMFGFSLLSESAAKYADPERRQLGRK